MARTTWFSIGVGIRRSLDRVLALNNNRKLTLHEKFYFAFMCAVLLFFIVSVFTFVKGNGPQPVTSLSGQQITPAERLAKAKAACGNSSHCLDPSEAEYQLSKIPASAAEYGDACKFLIVVQQQVADAIGKTVSNTDAKRQESWEQAQRNFQGLAHDSFECDLSTDHNPIVSFDNRSFWWKDDGRCEALFQKKRDEDAEIDQKKRDEDAEIDSYWSTTLRVDTDMDSFWLPEEERTCQTYPDQKGRVATVLCNSKGHANHNIPVKFWGGVDRNTTSNWKCRRESDGFVCRAID